MLVVVCTMHFTVCYYHVTLEISKSTLYSFPECQGTPYLNQVQYLNFK